MNIHFANPYHASGTASAPRTAQRISLRIRLLSENFARALQDFGVNASLTVYPGVGHDITADMRGQAMSFLEWQVFGAGIATQDRAVADALLRASVG